MSPSGTRIYVAQQVDNNNSLAVKVMGPSDGNQVWDLETCTCSYSSSISLLVLWLRV